MPSFGATSLPTHVELRFRVNEYGNNEVVVIYVFPHPDGLPVPMSKVGNYPDPTKSNRQITVFRERELPIREGAANVPLRHAHRFVPKQIHQDVDADLGVGELGGERVTQPVHQRRAGSLAVDAGFLEGAQDAVLQGSARDAFALGVAEQRCVRWPGGQSRGGGAAFGGGR